VPPSSNEDLRIREAELQDLPLLTALSAEAVRELGNAEVTQRGWQERFATYFHDRREAGEAQWFVACNGATIIGMSAASIINDHRAAVFLRHRGYISGVFVKPAFRRRGIARALTRAAMDWLKARGCNVARLRPSKQGEPLYRSMGFVPSGELEIELISSA
jgi:ribosomal protein S18 acetylase RimI-like enzyme